ATGGFELYRALLPRQEPRCGFRHFRSQNQPNEQLLRWRFADLPAVLLWRCVACRPSIKRRDTPDAQITGEHESAYPCADACLPLYSIAGRYAFALCARSGITL